LMMAMTNTIVEQAALLPNLLAVELRVTEA
jgi:hypothetical protein